MSESSSMVISRYAVLTLTLLMTGVLGAMEVKLGEVRTCASQDAGVLTSSEGEVTSPRFPYDYPNKQHCEWLIQGPDQGGLRIILQFKSISIEHNENDYVAVYDGPNVTSKRLTKLSGKPEISSMTDIISSGPELFILFVSDDTTSYSGFRAVYHSIDVALFNETEAERNEECTQLNLHGSLDGWQHEGLFIQTDQTLNSRPVYKQSGVQGDLYLYSHKEEGKMFWLVGDKLGSGKGYIFGDKAEGRTPTEKNIVWHEVQNNQFIPSGSLHVSCVKPASRLLRGPKSYFYLSDKLRYKLCSGRHVYHQIYPSCEHVTPGLYPECPLKNTMKKVFLYYVNKKGFTGWMIGPEQCVADGWIGVHDHAVRPDDISGQWMKRNSRGIYEEYAGFFIRDFDNWAGRRRVIKNHEAISPWHAIAPYEQQHNDIDTKLLTGILVAVVCLVVIVVVVALLWIFGKIPYRVNDAARLRTEIPERIRRSFSRNSEGTPGSRALSPRNEPESKTENESNEVRELVRYRQGDEPTVDEADMKKSNPEGPDVEEAEDPESSSGTEPLLSTPQQVTDEPRVSRPQRDEFMVTIQNNPAPEMSSVEVVDII